MSAGTGIEWTDVTWNPVTGCDKVSPGCAHCYAEAVAARFWHKTEPPTLIATPEGETARPRVFTDVRCHPERLDQPLRWRKPRRVFVNSMSDLFHDDVPDAFIDQVFAVMALAPQHTFQVLTKRPERMLEYFASMTFGSSIISEPSAYKRIVAAMDMPEWMPSGRRFLRVPEAWPLPNLWLGVSVENQHSAIERIPYLLETPAAVRFVSYEPALGGVNLAALTIVERDGNRPMCALNALTSHVSGPDDVLPTKLDWVIVGGESGPKARPCHVEWIRSIVRECAEAGTPCFVKQLGSNPQQFVMYGPATFESDQPVHLERLTLKDQKGGDMAEWPEDLRVRKWPRHETKN